MFELPALMTTLKWVQVQSWMNVVDRNATNCLRLQPLIQIFCLPNIKNHSEGGLWRISDSNR